MTIRLPKLQDNNKEAKKMRSEELLNDREDIREIFYYQGFLYISKIMCSKLISRHHNNSLVGHFGIKNT